MATALAQPRRRMQLVAAVALLVLGLGWLAPSLRADLPAPSEASDLQDRWLGGAPEQPDDDAIELRQPAAEARDAASVSRHAEPAVPADAPATQPVQARPPPHDASVAPHDAARTHRRPNPTGPPILG